MSVLSSLTELFTGGAFSGVTTLVSTAGGAIMSFKERKLEMSHELAMLPHVEKKLKVSIQLHQLQAQADQRGAENALQGKLADSETELTGSAIEADRSDVQYMAGVDGMPWQVAAIRTLFRPWLTCMLWVATFLIMIVKPTETPTTMIVISSITTGAEASLGLWFGSRMMSSGKEQKPAASLNGFI